MLQDRYQQLLIKIKTAAEKSGRSAESLTLVAVTKTIPSTIIREAVSLGIHNVGENKIQEAVSKRPDLPPSGITHHFIGHLQSNKARKAVELFDLIQSVDRSSLAKDLDRVAGEVGKKQRVLIEVKVSPEETRSGMESTEVPRFIEEFSAFKNLELKGLMAIAPLDKTAARRSFQQMDQLFQKFQPAFGPSPILSIGMSDDFEAAIEEGSTMVRIGRALFGDRV